jgi:MerR-like DNA binding protein
VSDRKGPAVSLSLSGPGRSSSGGASSGADPSYGGSYVQLEVAARLVRLPAARVRRYVRIGLVEPGRQQGSALLFGDAELARLRKIRRLFEDVGLNTAGVEIALRLLDEIDELRGTTDAHRAQ